MNQKQLSQFYSNLAALLNSGLTLERGLDTMKQGKKSSLLWMMDGLQHHIGRGGTLWEGMRQYPKFFDDFQVMIIKGAEESGTLVETFRKLAHYYETRYQARQRFLVSLIYPILLLHAVVVLPPLKYLVLENLNRSYASVVLPPLLIAYGIVGLGYLFWRKWGRSGPLREMADEVVLCLLVIGKLVRDISLARAFWSLSAMLTAGTEAVAAAQNAAAAAGNSVVKRQLSGALYVLEGGRTFKEYFAVTAILNTDQLAIVTVGEESGALPEALERMALQMEETNTHRFSMLMKGGGVLVYLIVAAIAAFTVISFYTNHFGF